MPIFDSLQRASFDGLEFPVQEVHVRCQYRKHTHEYLRVPGGVTEKLERGLYTVEMVVPFHATIRGYGILWPDGLAAMRGKFEQGITSALSIPTVGSIPAFIEEWDQTASMGRTRSGEMMRIPFLEDQTETFLTRALAQVDRSSLGTAVDKFALTLKDFEVSPAESSIFDAIQDGANFIFSIKDQTDLFGGLLTAKISQLTAIINEADRQLDSLKHPDNHALVDSLHELWDATVTLGKNLAEQPTGPRFYTTPRTMSVSDIANAVYGEPSRANEIMLNNDLADPFAVPAGTRIIYFAE